MTDLHVSPHWYAAAGPPVLIITLVAAFGMIKLFDLWERYFTKAPWRGPTKNQKFELEMLSKRTPTLETMRPKKQKKPTAAPATPPADTLPLFPETKTGPGLADQPPSLEKHPVAHSIAHPEPAEQKSVSIKPDATVSAPPLLRHPRLPQIIEPERMVPDLRGSSATVGFRRTVAIASEFERRLRMIREEGITARDEPSRIMLRG